MFLLLSFFEFLGIFWTFFEFFRIKSVQNSNFSNKKCPKFEFFGLFYVSFVIIFRIFGLFLPILLSFFELSAKHIREKIGILFLKFREKFVRYLQKSVQMSKKCPKSVQIRIFFRIAETRMNTGFFRTICFQNAQKFEKIRKNSHFWTLFSFFSKKYIA